MQYSDARQTLKTGDLVFFSGKGWMSGVIKFGQRLSGIPRKYARWSHVGIVIKSADIDAVLLWESTTLSDVKTVDGENRSGVQLVSLKDRGSSYKGKIGVRRLICPLAADELTHIKELRKTLKGRKYETNYLQLARAVFDPMKRQSKDLNTVFCSEMAAEALSDRLGDKHSNEYSPGELAQDHSDVFSRVAELSFYEDSDK